MGEVGFVSGEPRTARCTTCTTRRRLGRRARGRRRRGGRGRARRVSRSGPAGTITVHNCRTVHGSAPNRSDRARPLLLQTYARRRCVLVHGSRAALTARRGAHPRRAGPVGAPRPAAVPHAADRPVPTDLRGAAARGSARPEPGAARRAGALALVLGDDAAEGVRRLARRRCTRRPIVFAPPHARSRLTDQNVNRPRWFCCANVKHRLDVRRSVTVSPASVRPFIVEMPACWYAAAALTWYADCSARPRPCDRGDGRLPHVGAARAEVERHHRPRRRQEPDATRRR